MPYAQEYTPELDEQFLNRLLGKATAGGRARVGEARANALERGLSGDPYEASAVGRANASTDSILADLMSNFAFQKAGLQREERMIGEGREYGTSEREASQTWQSKENAENRALQRFLAEYNAGAIGNMQPGMGDYAARSGVNFGFNLLGRMAGNQLSPGYEG